MSSAMRLSLSALLASIVLAGCTPAHFVRHARPAPRCEVQVCVNPGGARFSHCECKTHDQLVRQTRHGFWPTRE